MVGDWRLIETFDFDWDSATISNTVENPQVGTTHRDKIYYIPGSPDYHCTETLTAPSTDMHGRKTSAGTFTVEFCCDSGKNPMVHRLPVGNFIPPDISMKVEGTMKSGDELDYHFRSSGFPSTAIRVLRNSAVADTTITNDPSCLSNSEVQDGVAAALNLETAFQLLQEDDRQIPRVGVRAVPPRLARICSPPPIVVVAAAGASSSLSGATRSTAPGSSPHRGVAGAGTMAGTRVAAPTGSGSTSTGTISGMVTSSSGSPLGGICASATDPFGGSATLVAVTAGSTVSGINGSLAGGGTITGTVTSGGSAVPNVCVDVQDASQNEVGVGATDVAGRYSVTGLPTGDYKVSFADCLGNAHTPQWYSGQPDFSSAGTVHVNVGATASGINAALAQTGSIAGTVKDAAGHPLADVCVSAQPVAAGTSATVTSDPAGAYTVSGLAAGPYLVDFRGCSAATQVDVHQWYSNALDSSVATAVTVAANSTTTGIDATLSAGGSITGTVTDSSGAPLANICVDAQPASSGIAQPLAALTDTAGHYTISAVPTATYTVSFDDCTGGLHLEQFYNGAASRTGAASVSVTAPAAVSGINAAMAGGGAIAGVVTDLGSGAPLPGICVDVFPNGVPAPVDTTTTLPDGSYRIAPLASGGYQVEFLDCRGGGHTTQWANNKASQAGADVITVTAGQTLSGVNAALSS